jgi:hypothetical protein
MIKGVYPNWPRMHHRRSVHGWQFHDGLNTIHYAICFKRFCKLIYTPPALPYSFNRRRPRNQVIHHFSSFQKFFCSPSQRL